jgi:hypothetical protein
MNKTLKNHLGEQVQIRVELTHDQSSSLQRAISEQVEQFTEVTALKVKRAELVMQAEQLKWGVTDDELSQAKDLFHDTFTDVDDHLLHKRTVLNIEDYGVEFEAGVEPASSEVDFSSLCIGRLSIAAINIYSWRILASLALRENRQEGYEGSDEPDAEIGFILDHEASLQIVDGLIVPYNDVLTAGATLSATLSEAK